jgi:hypothetical protein
MVMKNNSKNSPTLVKPRYEVKSESTLGGGHFRQKNIVFFFGYIWVVFGGSFSLISYKMDFDTKASSIILIVFQIKIIFQQNVFFQHTYVHLNEKLI